jgi:hypothetical protein
MRDRITHHLNKGIILKKLIIFGFLLSMLLYYPGCKDQQLQIYYQGITIAPPYSYYMSGRTDRVKGYLIRIDDPAKIDNPGLVFLASGIEAAGEAYMEINKSRYDLPPLSGSIEEKIQGELKSQGKAQFYTVTSGDDIVGKFNIPLDPANLVKGINEVVFFMTERSDGFEVLGARLESIDETEPTVVGQTYHLLSRGRPALMRDFDYVNKYTGDKVWHEDDIPDWARRGKVNFYRAGIDYNNLDRMFEMFEEAKINLVSVGVPRDKKSDAYKQVKSFIDRCHDNGIYITAFNSLGGVSLAELMLNPALEDWISHDEFGAKRWRQRGKVFAADLANVNYRNYELKHADHQIDTGVDELYYDYAIGGTGDVLDFLADVRAIAEEKGKQISIYGNCKGNILVDEVCDLTKSEGTTEAGIWDGKWVHNIPQARFYYAVGSGVKPYRSKYEGADPGVANPGAYDVRDGMKYGWKKPIAEASAFQSHFCIAEAGEKLRDGWVNKDNSLAMEVWKGITDYYTFLNKNQNLYTDVSTVSKIAVLAPPHIPSFEVSLKRDAFYNALSEENIMYEVVLLHRLNSADILKDYNLIIIPNISWINQSQLEALEAYKKIGGKIYTIGSSPELQRIANIVSPAVIFASFNTMVGRQELLQNIESMSGKPLISINNSRYIAANVVLKRDTDKYILHFVNYDKPVKNIEVRFNLSDFSDKVSENIQLLSPDDVPKAVKNIVIHNNIVSFTLPDLDIYDVVVVN